MNKKQILINGKIINYYEYKPHLNSSPQGEDEATERIQDRGSSENTLVFLHGWMQDGKSFEKIFKILEGKNIPYISLDLPGFGTSQLVHDNMTIEEYGDVVIQVIEKLGLTNVTLLGHSFGGRICIYLGSYYPNMQKIVLLCAAGIARKIPLHRYIIVKTGKIILSLPGFRALGSKLREGFSSPDMKDAGTMTKIFRNTIALDLQDKMKLIKIPTLMIWGDSDDQTPVSQGRIIHSHIKSSTFHVLIGSHFVHQEKDHEVSNLILDFIKK